MEFVNLTPFAAQNFTGYDTQDRPYEVAVLKTGYRLVPVADYPGYFHAELIEDDSLPLTMGDEHFGDPAASSIKVESDFVPFKPRCDVLLTGHAHCPGSHPARQWETRLRVGEISTAMPDPPLPPRGQDGLSVIRWDAYNTACLEHAQSMRHYLANPPWARLDVDKTLLVYGPRRFESGVLRWRATDPELTESVPLRWEHSYGGNNRVDDPEHPDSPFVNAVCFRNPIGCGWIARNTFAALKKAGQTPPSILPAPQITYPDDPVDSPDFGDEPPPNLDARLMAQIAYPHRPANYGPLGRAWAPRLARGGTYDDAWLNERHPYLPKDFDPAYWNGAPEDQQMDFPFLFQQKHAIELIGLVRHSHAPDGNLFAWLPPHRAMVFAYPPGKLVPVPMQPDTLTVDTDSLTLIIVWRAAILQGIGAERMEARFEIDPAAPWVKFKGDA